MQPGRQSSRSANRTINRLTREAVRRIREHDELHPLMLAVLERQRPRLPVDQRFEVFAHLRDLVQAHRGELAAVLMPFVKHETYAPLAAAATIDYCSLAPRLGDDPMSRPAEVATLLRDGRSASPGGVMAGLLMLGDPRVCRLVAPMRPSLALPDVERLARCLGGLAYKCVLEFLLDWIDEIVDRREPQAADLRSHLAQGLVRLLSGRLSPHIIDGERPFPVAQDGPWGQRLAAQAVAEQLRRRLYDLERREGEPSLMPAVIRAFGLPLGCGGRMLH